MKTYLLVLDHDSWTGNLVAVHFQLVSHRASGKEVRGLVAALVRDYNRKGKYHWELSHTPKILGNSRFYFTTRKALRKEKPHAT